MQRRRVVATGASMRPPQSAGEDATANRGTVSTKCRFNEAPAICGGRPPPSPPAISRHELASMRPPQSAGEDRWRRLKAIGEQHRFNEAPAICGGRRVHWRAPPRDTMPRFNEAPAICGGRHLDKVQRPPARHASMRPPQSAGEDTARRIMRVYAYLASMRPPQSAGEDVPARPWMRSQMRSLQ